MLGGAGKLIIPEVVESANLDWAARVNIRRPGNDVLQSTGTYLVAFVSGLTDIDAINIANLKLFSLGAIEATVAVTAVVIAFVANLLFKLGIIFPLGDKQLRVPATLGFFILLAGILSGLFLMPGVT